MQKDFQQNEAVQRCKEIFINNGTLRLDLL